MTKQNKRLLAGVLLTTEAETDAPSAGNGDGTENGDGGLPTGATVAITIAAVVVAEVGIFALLWFVIKKKKA